MERYSFIYFRFFCIGFFIVLIGIGVGASSLAQKITIELLNLSASSAITIKKTLSSIDKAITGNNNSPENISDYANQPENIFEGK